MNKSMESINFLYELQGENKIKYYESLINILKMVGGEQDVIDNWPLSFDWPCYWVGVWPSLVWKMEDDLICHHFLQQNCQSYWALSSTSFVACKLIFDLF